MSAPYPLCPLAMDGEPVNKKRRTTPDVAQGEPATLAGESTADALLLPANGNPADTAAATAAPALTTNGNESQATDSQPTPLDQVPDEDHAAPPSTAAGAHAKPLSALFKAKTPSPKKKRVPGGKPLTRVGSNLREDNKENFTELLARLNQDSEFRLRDRFQRADELPELTDMTLCADAIEEQEKWARPAAPKLNPQRDGIGTRFSFSEGPLRPAR